MLKDNGFVISRKQRNSEYNKVQYGNVEGHVHFCDNRVDVVAESSVQLMGEICKLFPDISILSADLFDKWVGYEISNDSEKNVEYFNSLVEQSKSYIKL